MIQSPLLGYSAFSQLLHRHQQGGNQQGQAMTSPSSLSGMARGPAVPQGAAGPVPQGVPLGVPGVPQFLASSLLQHLQRPQLAMGRCPSPPSPGSLSSVSPSPSSSPPTSLGCSLPASKSFTIDAILGLSQHGQHRDAYHRPHYMAEPPSSPTDLSLANRPLQQQQLSPRRSASGSDGTANSSKKSNGGSGGGSGGGGGGGGGGGKCKRVRTIFTADQLERLEAEFERQQYMVGPERLYLAHALNLTEAQVKVWFQNRRIKWRKQHLEVEQQRLAAIKQHPLQHAPQPPPHLQQQDDGHHHNHHHHHHRDLDSGSEDSVLSEDRSYFASLVMPHGVPDDLEAPDASPARARLVSALVGPLASPPCGASPVASPLASPLGSPGGGHGDGLLGGGEHGVGGPGLDQGHPGLAT